GRRRPGSVAAPLLALRSPGGVHPHPPGHGHRVRDPAGVLPQAAVRVPGDGAFGHRHRVHELGRVGPPHVRSRPRPGCGLRLFGGSMFGLFGGMYYWWPKAFGWMLNDKIGKLHFWLTFIGFNLTFDPMHILGLKGMPRRIYTYDKRLDLAQWNLVATIGAFVI